MALNRDDLEPPQRKKPTAVDLTPMSVMELQDYIAGLEAEIARARAAIAAKDAHRNAAAAFFKS